MGFKQMSNGPEQYANKQSIGEMLRSRREELHLSLEDISQRLRIRLVFLKALEDGQIDQLPGIAYASGFLRSYAEFLGLNVDEVIKRFRFEHQGTEYKQKLLFPAPVPQSGVPAAVIIFAGLLIIVGGYVGWYKMTDHRKVPAETIPSIMDKNGKDQAQEKISPQIASVMPSQNVNNAKPDQNVSNAVHKLESQIAQSQKTNEPASEPANYSQGDKNNSLQENKLSSHNSSIDNQQKPQEPSSIQTSKASDSSGKVDQQYPDSVKNIESKDNETTEKVDNNIIIRTSGASWLKVQDQQGRILLQKTLQKGESWTVPSDHARVVMTIGNAGAVIIENNGKQSRPLGERGKVLRHFVITPELLEKIVTEPVDYNSDAMPAKNKKKMVNENGLNLNNDQEKTEGSDNR